MTDEEKIAILTFVRDAQGTVGVSRTDILSFIYKSGINIEIGAALIDTCTYDNLIEKPWHSDMYKLTAQGTIWLRNEKFNVDRKKLTEIAYKVANSSVSETKKEKSSIRKGVEFLGWVIAIIGTIIATYYLLADHHFFKN